MMAVAGVIGVSSGVGGLYGSYYFDVASGPAIVLVASALFVLTLLLAPRRGVLWRQGSRRRSQRAALDDDLLKDAMLARDEEGLALDHRLLASRLALTPSQVRRSLARLTRAGLARAGLARSHGGAIALTEAGEKRATELVRTQRLLERYLHDVERMPLDHIRGEADRREHELSAAAVEDMSTLLGHPRTDPHGHPIPQPAEDRLRRIAGQSLATTLPGHGGRVSMISDDRADLLGEMVRLGILPEAQITVLSRAADGLYVRINDGEVAQLSIEIAGRVFVMPRLQAVADAVPTAAPGGVTAAAPAPAWPRVRRSPSKP